MLNPEIIPKNLPVKVDHCGISLIEIDIAPFSLLSVGGRHAVKVLIHKVQVEVEDLPEEQWDEYAEFDSLKTAALAERELIRAEAADAIRREFLTNLDIDPSKNSETGSMSFLRLENQNNLVYDLY